MKVETKILNDTPYDYIFKEGDYVTNQQGEIIIITNPGTGVPDFAGVLIYDPIKRIKKNIHKNELIKKLYIPFKGKIEISCE